MRMMNVTHVEAGALAVQAARIAHQRAIRPHHAVARHDDANRVLPVRPANRLRAERTAYTRRQRAVRDRLAKRNLAERVPHLLLERRPFWRRGWLIPA